MPKFAMYHYVEAHQFGKRPEGNVTFLLPERKERVWMWLQRSFVALDDSAKDKASRGPSGESLTLGVNLLSLRNNEPLCIEMSADQGGRITIRTDDMEVA